MKKAFITGVSGQDGSYLTELLLQKKYEVYGLNRRKSNKVIKNLETIIDHPNFFLIEGDLLEEYRLAELIRDIQPDEVYNLAGMSYVPASWESPIVSCNINALGVLRLLDAIRLFSSHTRFYQASSSEMYGLVQETPQNEMTYLYPRSPYGCAKTFAHNITRNYRESYGLYACNGILFNHESERRGEEFITMKIAKAVVRIKVGLQHTLKVGNIYAKRDWGYAPDYVEAMHLMLQQKKPDDYVVSSGENHTVKEFIEYAFETVGIKLRWDGTGLDEVAFCEDDEIRVKIKKKYHRPAEVHELCGNNSKAKKMLGWKPKTTFKSLIRKMVHNEISNYF